MQLTIPKTRRDSFPHAKRPEISAVTGASRNRGSNGPPVIRVGNIGVEPVSAGVEPVSNEPWLTYVGK